MDVILLAVLILSHYHLEAKIVHLPKVVLVILQTLIAILLEAKVLLKTIKKVILLILAELVVHNLPEVQVILETVVLLNHLVYL